MKEEGFLICPPLSQYPKPPDDQPGCRLVECIHCNKQMWLSAKKVNMIESGIPENNVFCYECFYNFARKNPQFILNSEMRQI